MVFKQSNKKSLLLLIQPSREKRQVHSTAEKSPKSLLSSNYILIDYKSEYYAMDKTMTDKLMNISNDNTQIFSFFITIVKRLDTVLNETTNQNSIKSSRWFSLRKRHNKNQCNNSQMSPLSLCLPSYNKAIDNENKYSNILFAVKFEHLFQQKNI